VTRTIYFSKAKKEHSLSKLNDSQRNTESQDTTLGVQAKGIEQKYSVDALGVHRVENLIIYYKAHGISSQHRAWVIIEHSTAACQCI
jgi:hypothetical protein